MNDTAVSAPPRWFWVVAVIALIWNLLGVMAYLMQVMMTPEAFAAMGEAERALYNSTPAWVTGAFALSVFAGTAGCVGLLLRRRWAVAAYALSLVGLFFQFGYTFFFSNAVEVLGESIAIMPILVTIVALLLFWFSRRWVERGWLR